MSNVETKENTVPGCFDRELYDALDKCRGKNPCAAADIIFDSGRAGVDKGLFPEIDRLGEEFPATPEEEVLKSQIPMESPSMEMPTPTPGACGTAFTDGKFALVPCEEKPAVHSAPRKKRKRQTVPPSVEESDDFKSQLYSMLESSSRVLTAHVESQNLNSQLDRNQRKEHAESLVGVLGKFADALGKIAERL